MWRAVAALAMSVLFVSTTSGDALADDTASKARQCDAIRIAERYLVVHFPNWDSIKHPPVVEEQGDTWLVSYKFPEGVLGSAPEIVVDKKTLKVVRSAWGQ